MNTLRNMGFNIGLSSNTVDDEIDNECDKFIDRVFYTWISEYNLYQEESCIIKMGKFFKFELKPLTKVTYVDGDIDDPLHYGVNLQDVTSLINLLSNLIDKLKIDKLDFNTLDYNSKSESKYNLWKKYFENGDLLKDVTTFKQSLECFKSKGIKEVFITAM